MSKPPIIDDKAIAVVDGEWRIAREIYAILEYAYDEDRLVLRGGLSTHKHVFKSELKSG